MNEKECYVKRVVSRIVREEKEKYNWRPLDTIWGRIEFLSHDYNIGLSHKTSCYKDLFKEDK